MLIVTEKGLIWASKWFIGKESQARDTVSVRQGWGYLQANRESSRWDAGQCPLWSRKGSSQMDTAVEVKALGLRLLGGDHLTDLISDLCMAFSFKGNLKGPKGTLFREGALNKMEASHYEV